MNFLSPTTRQLIVASAPQLAAVSIGGLTGYPAVLLNQLKENDSSIELDLNTSSWIASIHGLAGIPSILIPTFMQWKGRKFAFIAACLSTLIGWILTCLATDTRTILIGESFHGFGGNSLIAVSLITISEMVDPKFRSTSMVLFGISQLMGAVLVTFVGYFLHWRMVSVVMGVPTFTALLLVVVWPESPPWLACKGKFGKCEEAFILLRGMGKDATKELTELVRAQKESRRQKALQKSLRRSGCTNVWLRFISKDFFLPILHVTIIMFIFYFSGLLVIFTYAVDIIASTTKESDFICFIFMDVVIILGVITSVITMKYFNNKPIMIVSLLGSGLFLVLSSIVMYGKNSDILPKQTLLVCVLGFFYCSIFGSANLTFNISAELIPVKHRGLGGAFYIVISCLFHSGALKISPYMFVSIDMAGTFLVFACVSILGAFFIWKFIPETKGRTLQEIEDFYNYGSFIENQRLNEENFEITVVDDYEY